MPTTFSPDPIDMEHLEVRILDRNFRLQVPESEKATLMEAVELVDGRMRQLREASRASSPERIAINAALQIAYEFLSRDTSDPSVPLSPARAGSGRPDWTPDHFEAEIQSLVSEADEALRAVDRSLRHFGTGLPRT